MRGISLFLNLLAEHCPDIRSVWVIGARTEDEVLGTCSPFGWDLLAFADEETLQLLRAATDLHRSDVRLRVVTDGNRFEPAWGDAGLSGSLSGWSWKRVSEREAFYAEDGLASLRPGRKAVRLSEKSFSAPLGVVQARPAAAPAVRLS